MKISISTEITSEAEVGDSSSSGNVVDDELPTVSSQSTSSSFIPQVRLFDRMKTEKNIDRYLNFDDTLKILGRGGKRS